MGSNRLKNCGKAFTEYTDVKYNKKEVDIFIYTLMIFDKTGESTF